MIMCNIKDRILNILHKTLKIFLKRIKMSYHLNLPKLPLYHLDENPNQTNLDGSLWMHLHLYYLPLHTTREIKTCFKQMVLLSKMLLIDDRLDHEFQNNPFQYLEILKSSNFKLMAWNQDENLTRENKSNHIQKSWQDSEGLT